MKKLYNIINTFFIMLCVIYNLPSDNIVINNSAMLTPQINPIFIEINNVILEKTTVNRLYFSLTDIIECYKLDILDTKIDFIIDYRRNDCFAELVSYNSTVSSVFRVNNKIYNIEFIELFIYKNDIILTFKTNDDIETILDYKQKYSIIWDMPYLLFKQEYYTLIDIYDPFMDNFNNIIPFIDEYKQLFLSMFQ